MRVLKNVGFVCALVLLLSLVAVPASAIPDCSECNCNISCTQQCWWGPHLSQCINYTDECKEICEFQFFTEQTPSSLESFLLELERSTPSVEQPQTEKGDEA